MSNWENSDPNWLNRLLRDGQVTWIIGDPVHVIRPWYVPPPGPSKPNAKKKAVR